jgi:hypothetical protein
MANTGLRPDEAPNLEHRDVEIVIDDETGQHIIEIEVRGKRGVGFCKSMPNAVRPYERLLGRPKPVQGESRRLRHRRAMEGITGAPETPVAELPKPTDSVFPGNHVKLFNGILDKLAYAADAQQARGSEAQPLLAAREYRAAVIAAMSGLDVVLQKYVGSAIKPTMSVSIHRPLPMRMMLDHALEMGLISEVEQRHIREGMGVRNTAIHEGVAVSAKVAKSIIDGVNRIIGKIIGQT